MSEEIVKSVSSKEKARALAVTLGTVEIAEQYKGWFKNVKSDGTVVAFPPVRKSVSPEELARREAEKVANRKSYSDEGVKLGIEALGDEESLVEYRSKLAVARAKKREEEKIANAEKRLADRKARNKVKAEEELAKIKARKEAMAKKEADLLAIME